MRFLRLIVTTLSLLAAFASPALAQKTKANMLSEINSNIPNNVVGAITPAIVRTTLTDMLNSWQQYAGVNAQTGTTYTVLVGDYGQLVTFSNGSAVAVTLPQATSSFSTFNFYALNKGAGTVTITPQGGSTINGAASYALTTNQSVWIVSDGVNYQIFVGSATASAGGSNTQVQINNSGSLGGSANLTWVSPALTIGVAASTTGQLVIAGSVSGSSTLTVGTTTTGTLTLPSGTDTLVGKATTDTFTNKNYNTAGTGNVFQINSNTISAVTGSGNTVVLSTSPTLVTPILGVATATSINSLTISASTGTLAIANGKTFTASNTLTLTGTDSTSFAFPSSSDTVVTLTASQALTNKSVNGLTISATTGTLAIANAKTATISNTLTLAGTDATTMTFPSSNGTIAALNIASQTVTGGTIITSLTQSTGSITVNCGSRPLQYITNGGAFTITAPANDGSCILLVTNNASAGAITFSGFSVGSNTGDSLTTTNTNAFSIHIWRVNSVSGYRIAAHQ